MEPSACKISRYIEIADVVQSHKGIVRKGSWDLNSPQILRVQKGVAMPSKKITELVSAQDISQ